MSFPPLQCVVTTVFCHFLHNFHILICIYYLYRHTSVRLPFIGYDSELDSFLPPVCVHLWSSKHYITLHLHNITGTFKLRLTSLISPFQNHSCFSTFLLFRPIPSAALVNFQFHHMVASATLFAIPTLRFRSRMFRFELKLFRESLF